MKNTQIIGMDLGRGYAKGYTEYNGMKKKCLFKSVVGQGRGMDFSEFENPIYIELEGEDYFAGLLAEKEGYNTTRNSKDDKTTFTARKLFCAVLNEIAVEDNVSVMLGVPNKMFRKSVLNEVKEFYKGKVFSIKDKIKGGKKDITITDISIYRESDAALMWEVNDKPLNDKPLGMVTVGFRTTEVSYFDKGLKFNDKKSKSIEKGNKDVLDYVRKKLEEKNISKELYEIDSSTDYDDLKKVAYRNLTENIEQEIEDFWVNDNEMDIRIAGGTAINMDFNTYKVVKNPQMTTAKGLFSIGERTFR